MTRVRAIHGVALLAAALIGAVLTVALRGEASAPASAPPLPVTTARLVRTDLRTTVLTGATLAYGAAGLVVKQLSGTYTQLPAQAAIVRPGEVLYRTDNIPAVLMAGSTPAWRVFALGMTDGPDVAELQSDLIAGGFARGLLSAPSGHFDLLTLYAVERWQLSEGELATGAVPLGEIVFLRTGVRIGHLNVSLGQAASPGQSPFTATTATEIVVVPLNPNLPTVANGGHVSIVLPSGATTPGRVSAVGAPAPAGSQPSPLGSLIITPSARIGARVQPGAAVQVALTTALMRRALAAPIAGLLALAGGGYGLEVVERSGGHRLVSVRTGMFAGSQVQVTGSGIAAGTRVVVAQ